MSQRIQQLIGQLDEAMRLCRASNAPQQVLDALTRSRESARSLAAEVQTGPGKQAAHSGVIEWTFMEEQGGREILAHVYYDWDDYSPGDHVTPSYGGFAQVTDIQVGEIRYYSSEGELISREEHDREFVWKLAEQSMEELEAACTKAGYLSKAGRPRPLYFPGTSLPSRPVCSEDFRMAPSARQRCRDERSREVG